MKRLSIANVNPNACVNKNSIASSNAKMNPIPSKPIIKMNANRNSVTLTTKPKNKRSSVVDSIPPESPTFKSRKAKNRNSLAFASIGSEFNYENEAPLRNKTHQTTDSSSMKLLSSVVTEDFMSPLSTYEFTPYASYGSPSLLSPTVISPPLVYENGNGETTVEDPEPIVPPSMSPILTADIPANDKKSKRVSYVGGNSKDSKSGKSKKRVSVNSSTSIENMSDSLLREINKNSSRAISKHNNTPQKLNKSKESKKNKRKSIFAKIFS